MLIRVATLIRELALAERIRRALQVEPEPGDTPDEVIARRRFDSVVLTELEDEADPVERLRREPQDLLITLATSGTDPEQIRTFVDQLEALPERTGLILLHLDDAPRAHAALLGVGCMAVLWTGLSSEGLGEALASLFERRRDESIARAQATKPAMAEPEPMVAASPVMRELLETVRRVAVADSPVLVLGETGVGKERIAQLLHAWSPRSRGPFIALNCAAIPSELFESELFGHERGAFTGAVRSRRGQFELAHRGTLFLDEIAEIPPAQQAKLLRALQDRRIRPIGGDRELPVDVRVVAATNQDLRGAMEAGRFRRDLFYRLGVVELVIPPLRERPDDIRELARRYAKQFATRLGRPIPVPNEEALARLAAHDWPGNVRELINVVERAVLLCTGVTITPADLPARLGAQHGQIEPETTRTASRPALGVVGAAVELPPAWLEQPWKQVREQLLLAGERAYLIGLLRACGGRIGDCARRAGIAERSLFEKMKRHGLRKEDFRSTRDPETPTS
jgi:two-component system response regulator AtoC